MTPKSTKDTQESPLNIRGKSVILLIGKGFLKGGVP